MTATPPTPPLHASCVAIQGRGVLILGPSGAGKSDLALRLIDRGAVLVADAYVELDPDQHPLMARAPDRIAGMIELRGLGICHMAFLSACPLVLVVQLVAEPTRMPPEWPRIEIAGQSLPVVEVNPVAASAPILVEWALRQIQDKGPVE